MSTNYEISDEFEKRETNKEVIQNNGSLNKLTGHFDMRNVTFGYNTTMPALIKDFNLSLKPGSRVALVGGSGSGKSTVARLASGLYEPWKGEIRFDNKLRKDIPRPIITESVAVIAKKF